MVTKAKKGEIEINEEFKKALHIMEDTSNNVFITGRAGTGKSTLLSYFRDTTQKNIVVLSPTGVGAVNVKGQTIHSFFRFKPNITPQTVKRHYKENNPKNIYKKLDAIVIDEVSMVRADLLDCVDASLRLNGPDKTKPFGGLQMILIGDLYQLPPVVTKNEKEIFTSHYNSEYFFDAHVFECINLEFLELEKVYRQKEASFINILNSIRNNTVTNKQLNDLNSRVDSDFVPPDDELYIYLTPTNAMAQEINESRLDELDGETYTSIGEIDGKFGKEYLPTSKELDLKVGAQIMLLNNDQEHLWVNGTIAEILAIKNPKNENPSIIVELETGKIGEVTINTWEIYNFEVVGGKLKSKLIGSFRQFPIKLAWAVTIHKSQGKTFEKVIIDMGRGAFAHGQTYVALSRCVSLDGIILKKPIKKGHVLMDRTVVSFLTKFQYKKSNDRIPLEEKVDIIKNAIENKRELEIIYLKASDEKTHRTLKPSYVGEMSYNGISYMGFKAFCPLRKTERAFRVDRILEISTLPLDTKTASL